MKLPKGLVIALAALIIMGGSVFALRHYLPHSGLDLAPKSPPSVVLAMNDVYLEGIGQDGKLWTANADKIEVGQDRNRTHVTGLHNGKVLDGKEVLLSVEAGKAVYDSFSRGIDLWNGVKVTGQKGQKISGNGANWNWATQTLRSNGGVSYEAGSTKITTNKLTVSLKNKEMEMWDVQMEFNVDEFPRLLQEADKNAQ